MRPINRREFIRSAATTGAFGTAGSLRAAMLQSQDSESYFGVHAFIENNPDAVFIMRTDVDVKTNGDAIKSAASLFAENVFVSKTAAEGGFPLSHKIVIKPNLTCSKTSNNDYSLEYGMGIITDPYFVEGIIERMKQFGIPGNQFFLREANCPEDFGPRGYTAMAERTGADLLGGVTINDDMSLINWVDVPNGMAFRKIPYIWPVNTSDSVYINIAKFKAHGMGLTLTAKNHQGAVAKGYCGFCGDLSGLLSLEHINPNARDDITESYERHCADGYSRWDRYTDNWNSGRGMEVWSQMTIDNHSVTSTALHIIEGIYARDGNGFLYGPNPAGNEDNPTGEAWDYMTNIIIFGKNAFHVDSIGFYLGGHEPGNLGYLHTAVERGLSSIVNPWSIPLYEWADGGATTADLGDYERTPLKTYYLQKDYNGQTETYYHLIDEPFDYNSMNVVAEDARPETFILNQNYPNPFNPRTTISFTIPRAGQVRLEIFTVAGQLIEVLADGYHPAGAHMVTWNTRNRPAGIYIYRLRYGAFSETKRMTLLK